MGLDLIWGTSWFYKSKTKAKRGGKPVIRPILCCSLSITVVVSTSTSIYSSILHGRQKKLAFDCFIGLIHLCHLTWALQKLLFPFPFHGNCFCSNRSQKIYELIFVMVAFGCWTFGRWPNYYYLTSHPWANILGANRKGFATFRGHFFSC